MSRRWLTRCVAAASLVAMSASFTPTQAIGPRPGAAVPVVFSISTTKPVVFLTIDDGWYRDPSFPTMLRRSHVPTSLFLIRDAARKDYNYFRRLQDNGATVEDHTVSHPDCTSLTRVEQRQEICRTANAFGRQFGRRPTLFRPPYGRYDLATRRAAADCGMRALVYWDVTVNSGRLAYAIGDRLRPGDIILMHFTPRITTDFTAAMSAIHAAGLHVRRLEDYL
jgi:peptidoglycan/xylan/chitin deacetylase (PgdA/CDA1 family)